MRILKGATTEHWLDRRMREHKSFCCPGNYIRIPAAMLVKFQEIRNKDQKQKLSLIEQQRQWEAEHGKEDV